MVIAFHRLQIRLSMNFVASIILVAIIGPENWTRD